MMQPIFRIFFFKKVNDYLIILRIGPISIFTFNMISIFLNSIIMYLTLGFINFANYINLSILNLIGQCIYPLQLICSVYVIVYSYNIHTQNLVHPLAIQLKFAKTSLALNLVLLLMDMVILSFGVYLILYHDFASPGDSRLSIGFRNVIIYQMISYFLAILMILISIQFSWALIWACVFHQKAKVFPQKLSQNQPLKNDINELEETVEKEEENSSDSLKSKDQRNLIK